MGLKDRYAQMTGANPAPSVAPTAAPAASSPAPAAASSAQASMETPTASSQPSTAPAGRDLAAVRARLAQRQSPGVNPPEAKIPETAFDRTTAEAPDGTPIPLENHQDVLKAAAKAAASTPAATPAASTATGELTRGQKAAATRAANKVKAAEATTAPAAEPSTPAPTAAPAPSAPAVGSLAACDFNKLMLHLDRIATSLEYLVELKKESRAQ